MPAKTRAKIALLIAAIVWGISPPIIKSSFDYISPINFLYFRFLLTVALLFIPFIYQLRKVRPTKTDYFWYLFIGFLSAPVNLLLFFYGLQKTTAIDASVISIVGPVMIILGGLVFLKEKINRRESIGILIAVFGTIITIVQPLFENVNTPTNNILGNILVFLGTIAGAAYTLLYKKFSRRNLDPFILTVLSFAIGIVTLWPFLYLSKQPITLPIAALPGILYMTIFGSAIAYFAHSYGISKIAASKASIFTYLQPVFGIPISIIFLHEQITLAFIVGAALIAVGVYVSEKPQT